MKKLHGSSRKALLTLCSAVLVGSLLPSPASATSPWILTAPYEGSNTGGSCDGPYNWTSGIRFSGGNINADSSMEPNAATGATAWSLEAETWPETVSPGYATLYCDDVAVFDAGSFEIHSPSKERIQIEAKFRIDGYSASQEDVAKADDWDQIDAFLQGYILTSAACWWTDWGQFAEVTLLDTDSAAPVEGGILTASVVLEANTNCARGTTYVGTVDVDVIVDAEWTVTSNATGWRRSSLDIDMTLLEVALTELS